MYQPARWDYGSLSKFSTSSCDRCWVGQLITPTFGYYSSWWASNHEIWDLWHDRYTKSSNRGVQKPIWWATHFIWCPNFMLETWETLCWQDQALLTTGCAHNTDLAATLDCSACTIHHCWLEFGLSASEHMVFSKEHSDGQILCTYQPRSAGNLSDLTDDYIDWLVLSIYYQFPSFGHQMLGGYLLELGHHVPCQQLEESHHQVVGPSTHTFAPQRLVQQAYSVPGPIHYGLSLQYLDTLRLHFLEDCDWCTCGWIDTPKRSLAFMPVTTCKHSTWFISRHCQCFWIPQLYLRRPWWRKSTSGCLTGTGL